MHKSEAATGGVLSENLYFEILQNSQEKTCTRVSTLNPQPQPCNFIKIETLAQVFSCEFCEISKNAFSTEHVCVTASEKSRQSDQNETSLLTFSFGKNKQL